VQRHERKPVGALPITDTAGTDMLDFSGLDFGVPSGTGLTVDLTSNTLPSSTHGTVTLGISSGVSSMENITGTKYNDTLTGNNSGNTLTGGDGDDTYKFPLTGTTQSDIITDTAGIDTLDFTGFSWGTGQVGINLNLANGNPQQVANSGVIFTLTLGSSQIENVTGSAKSDTITGNGLNNILNGDGNNDTYKFGSNTGTYTILDSGGADTLAGRWRKGSGMVQLPMAS
jgi:Ca2+-binding RTX toxin-like protein